MKTLRPLWGLVLAILSGCAFGPVNPDPNEKVYPMATMLIREPFVLELISVNGHMIPNAALDESFEKIKEHITGPITIKKGASTTVELDEGGFVTDIDLYTNVLPLRTAVGPSTVTAVFLPMMNKYSRGFAVSLSDGGALIVLYAVPIADDFLSEERTWEIVFTHEFGHVLGVPYAKNHKWHANHCTYPTCRMYPKADFRAIWSTIWNFGVYDEYCKICTEELKQERSDTPEENQPD